MFEGTPGVRNKKKLLEELRTEGWYQLFPSGTIFFDEYALGKVGRYQLIAICTKFQPA